VAVRTLALALALCTLAVVRIAVAAWRVDRAVAGVYIL
jgi:hypothetical protein